MIRYSSGVHSFRHKRRVDMRVSKVSIIAVAAAALQMLGTGVAAAECSKESWTAFEQQLLAAQAAFGTSNGKSVQALWSHARDVSILGAAGGYEVGWELVGPRLAWASRLDPAQGYAQEVLSRVVDERFALVVQIEKFTHRNPDGTIASVNQLRVTNVARCEGTAWRLIHRHADRQVAVNASKVR
jgi:hypothetical protein